LTNTRLFSFDETRNPCDVSSDPCGPMQKVFPGQTVTAPLLPSLKAVGRFETGIDLATVLLRSRQARTGQAGEPRALSRMLAAFGAEIGQGARPLGNEKSLRSGAPEE
jgi:hypothetical protein